MDLRKPVIFATGAATLALELVASRAMTPYFGVSLFIWAGILSTTLVCLATGYWLGGSAARRGGRSGAKALFGTAPAAAGLLLAAAAALYPGLFPGLARLHLALGSVLACAVLLGPALIALSAMNPLLVAALRPDGDGGGGDAGSGAVFAWSTFGSVAGVGIAAFALIPNLGNFHSLLVIAGVLGGLSLMSAVATDMDGPWRRRAGLAGAGAVALAVAVFMLSVVERRALEAGAGEIGYRVVATVPTAFGTLKVVDIGRDLEGPPETVQRFLLADGMNMGAEDLTGRPTVGFAYALEAIALGHPAARTALVLGLGMGSVPELLAARGLDVDVVEINPDVVDVAVRQFGFDPGAVTIHRQDARLFVRACPRRYDAVLIDLFAGDGIPEHLVTAEFFADLERNCLAEGAVLGFNTLYGPAAPPARSALVATIVKSFGPAAVMLDGDPGDPVGNAYIAVPPGAYRQDGFAAAPGPLPGRLRRAFADPVVVTPAATAAVPALTDGFNTYPYRAMGDQIAYRRSVVRALPPALLVN